MLPGNPPVFDWLLVAGVLLLVAVIASRLVTCRVWRRDPACGLGRTIQGAQFLLGLFAVLGLLTGAIAIGSRHAGDWRPVRDALRKESSRIRAEVGGRALTDDEWYRFDDALARRNLRFDMNGGRETLSIRVVSRQAPYVGVSIGGSKYARFNPLTMFCEYAE